MKDFTFKTTTAINYADYRLDSDRRIHDKLLEAAHVFDHRWFHSRLVFKKPQTYTINLVNHLGEVIETDHTYDKDLEIEVLCDGDMYRAMNTTDKTMAEWFSELKDSTAARLFDMSMTQSIYNVEWSIVGDKANISIWFSDSVDGQTNIDHQVVQAILDIIDLKREWWGMLLNRMDRTRTEVF